ncbi:adaptor protein MecA, partial [Planococcus sp. SIMBA_143]
FMQGNYYMLLSDDDLEDMDKEDVIAIMSEYSSPSIITSYRLIEYGKQIYVADAVKNIMKSFHID